MTHNKIIKKPHPEEAAGRLEGRGFIALNLRASRVLRDARDARSSG